MKSSCWNCYKLITVIVDKFEYNYMVYKNFRALNSFFHSRFVLIIKSSILSLNHFPNKALNLISQTLYNRISKFLYFEILVQWTILEYGQRVIHNIAANSCQITILPQNSSSFTQYHERERRRKKKNKNAV